MSSDFVSIVMPNDHFTFHYGSRTAFDFTTLRFTFLCMHSKLLILKTEFKNREKEKRKIQEGNGNFYRTGI